MLTPKNREGKKKCKCGNEFVQYNTIQKLCVACLIKKGRKIRNKESKLTDRERKEKEKKLSELISEARKVFQMWIRKRDFSLPCISCDTNKSEVWDGGHYLKAELYSGLIFEERNCHKQCRKCNYFRGGAENEFRMGLVMRYGSQYVNELEELSVSQRVKKYSREELKEIKNKYQSKLREIEKL